MKVMLAHIYNFMYRKKKTSQWLESCKSL